MPVLPDVRDAADADHRGAPDQDGPAALALPRLPAAAAPFSRLAAHSAACADEQGKYWEQHQKIYEGQAEWAAARDAAAIFRQYAQANGLDLAKYDACMSGGKYAGRIQASYEEGTRVGVSSTPTLLVGGRLYQGRLDSDAITRLVDSLAPRTSAK